MIDMAGRLALRAYPPSFRERYGRELEALVEDTGGGPSVVADLLVGALKAWLHPVMPDGSAEGRRRRMQASVATTWVTWCAALYALPVLSFIVSEEPWPTPGSVRRLLDVAQYAMYGAGLILLVGALALLAESSRNGSLAAWRPLVVLIPTLPTWVIAPLLLMFASIDPFSYWVGALAVLGPAVSLIFLAVTPAVVVTRCRPSARVLRLLALCSVAVALAVTTTGVACVAVVTGLVMNTGDAAQLVTMPVVAVTVAVSAAALVSSGRGAKAALHSEQPVDHVGVDV